MHRDHQLVSSSCKFNAVCFVISFIGCLLPSLTLRSWAAASFDQYRVNEAKVKAIARDPKSIGQDEIGFLAAHSNFHQAVEALSQANAPEARAALWNIAAGGNAYAARLIARKLTNKLETVQWLKSPSYDVREVALDAMWGCVLDPPAWKELQRILAGSSLRERELATRVAGADPEGVPAAEKAREVVKAMQGLDALAGAQQKQGYGHPVILEGAAYEFALMDFIEALTQMRGLEWRTLRDLTPKEGGVVRDCLVVARLARRDASVRDDFLKILRDQPSPVLRWAAVRAVYSAGKPEFQPVLTDCLSTLAEVAEKDPFVMPKYLPGTIRTDEDMEPRPYYTVREAAKRAMDFIQPGWYQRPSSRAKPAKK